MNQKDDILEFLELTEKTPVDSEDDRIPKIGLRTKKADESKPDRPTQFSLYRNGYSTTGSTISTLPSGCYDIKADSKMVFVVPTAPPSGLLLELPGMGSEEVIKITNNFWDSENDYKLGNDFVVGGAAFKAGIMLYGPGGSGKSSTLKLLSKKLVERNGIVFYASGPPDLTMEWLANFAQIEPTRKSIVILEDIDSLIDSFDQNGYLEMLDSAKSADNILFIATTNYPDRLEPRIYNRPGRFSHVIKIGVPGPEARRIYLQAILKNHRDIEQIVAKSQGFTIDHLTALINAVYREKKDLLSEIERLRLLFKVPKSDDKAEIGIGSRGE